MSDTYINIRFKNRHFQLTRDWKIQITTNNYHKAPWPDGRFRIYEFFGFYA